MSGMFGIERNDSCKSLILVISVFSIYTHIFNVMKKQNSFPYSALTPKKIMIKSHFFMIKLHLFKLLSYLSDLDRLVNFQFF